METSPAPLLGAGESQEPPPCLACLWVGEPGAWRGAQGPGEVTQSRVASSVAPVGPTHPSDMASPARWSKRVEAKVLAPCLPLSLGPVWAASVPFLGAHAAKLFQPRLPARGARLDGAYTAWVGGFPLPPQECRAQPCGGRHRDLTWPHLPTPLHGSYPGAGTGSGLRPLGPFRARTVPPDPLTPTRATRAFSLSRRRRALVVRSWKSLAGFPLSKRSLSPVDALSPGTLVRGALRGMASSPHLSCSPVRPSSPP